MRPRLDKGFALLPFSRGALIAIGASGVVFQTRQLALELLAEILHLPLGWIITALLHFIKESWVFYD
jgi:hypothetical protein